MALIFLDPGLLRRRVRLEAAVAVPDGSGGIRQSFGEVAELSAHVEPVSAEVQERFAAREGRVTHRVICRFRPDVVRGMAFVFQGRRLAIRTVHDPDESERFLVCRCEEEA
ncbi:MULTISPECIES: phage head closure protein [unclassified Aureimonas]|uniref:phage head closure protein n=1 Tax=unclassified Aureimonas TaxID=2615206 RepID=UPI0006FD6F8E|nr:MULTISPECIES: phage head closure protein [unclassified Aureimonas]KQT55267.1 hypothetical protein ASG62_10575 [Aureimonas sp. Leaf427]KQT71058.1 hypothetical protein ASG54_20960 [Aureimonas sp. Leaf460]